jgi:integrase
VPIHSALKALVKRRQSGKRATEFVFHEAGSPREGLERSMAASKRFGNYRRRVGVHEREPGRKQSNVDFHSFRRWFITTARNAGIDRATVAAVVGHEVGNITDDVYSGGPSVALMVACVEAVKLPAL